jgi:hypothetical protein
MLKLFHLAARKRLNLLCMIPTLVEEVEAGVEEAIEAAQEAVVEGEAKR